MPIQSDNDVSSRENWNAPGMPQTPTYTDHGRPSLFSITFNLLGSFSIT